MTAKIPATDSIYKVQEAAKRLSSIMQQKYPAAKGRSTFEVGVDPYTGKYSILVSFKDRSLGHRVPQKMDGFRVIIDGITPDFNPQEIGEGPFS